jgi:hypothetical protein
MKSTKSNEPNISAQCAMSTPKQKCQLCKRSVHVFGDTRLCLMCHTFRSFWSIIKLDTDLSEGEARHLAKVLAEYSLGFIAERLYTSGQPHPLLDELLELMERVEQPH